MQGNMAIRWKPCLQLFGIRLAMVTCKLSAHCAIELSCKVDRSLFNTEHNRKQLTTSETTVAASTETVACVTVVVMTVTTFAFSRPKTSQQTPFATEFKNNT